MISVMVERADLLPTVTTCGVRWGVGYLPGANGSITILGLGAS